MCGYIQYKYVCMQSLNNRFLYHLHISTALFLLLWFSLYFYRYCFYVIINHIHAKYMHKIILYCIFQSEKPVSLLHKSKRMNPIIIIYFSRSLEFFFFWMCTHQWGHVHVIKENDRMMTQGNYVWTDGNECNVNEVTCCHSDKNHSLFVKQESVYSLIESLSLSFSSSHFFCFVLSFIFCCIAVLFFPVCSLATRAFWCLLGAV